VPSIEPSGFCFVILIDQAKSIGILPPALAPSPPNPTHRPAIEAGSGSCAAV
jgi:hypothetical protein